MADALEGLGGGPVVELAGVAALPRALARLVLRSLAERPPAGPRSLSRADVDAVLRLGGRAGRAPSISAKASRP